MSYKLFYSPGACSMAVHVLLNELQQPFELLAGKNADGSKTTELMAANTRGEVPVLITPEGQSIREGGAILAWLCDMHQSPLLPSKSSERATALEWLMTANASLHPAYGAHFMMLKNNVTSPEMAAAITKKINTLWSEIEQQLGKTNAYIAGAEMTVADILLTVIANWNGYLKTPVQFGPNCQRLFKTVSARSSFQKALATEHVEYKAAA